LSGTALLNDSSAASDTHFQRRVLAVGPGEGFVTGQSMAFLTYARNSRHKICVVNTNDEGRTLLFRALSSIRVILGSARQILARRPDCVYISTSRSKLGAIKDIAVIAVARFMRVPVVNHLHGISFVDFRESLGSLYGSVVDWAYGHIAASIVLHEKLLAQYARYPRMRLRVVNNFVDAELARTLGAREPAGPVKVLFLSNLMPEKGLFELIDSVKHLLVRFPGKFNLKIAGRFLAGAGMSRGEVEKRFLQSIDGLAEIEYRGFADAAVKGELLRWADVLALPSYMKEEAVPLVVLEGMAAGCYLIVSDFGILPDLVAGLAGAVVPSRDAAALEDALSRVLADGRLLRAAAALNPSIAPEKYSEARYISGVDAIIEECAVEVRR
jgi:glycosyltransferase involved in cell wall biosynthesis